MIDFLTVTKDSCNYRNSAHQTLNQSLDIKNLAAHSHLLVHIHDPAHVSIDADTTDIRHICNRLRTARLILKADLDNILTAE